MALNLRYLNELDLVVDVVRSESAWDQLAYEWNPLVERCSKASVFLTWEWLRPWWKCFRTPKDNLFILTVRKAGKLVGLAPLYIKSVSVLGVFKIKKIGFIGDSTFDSDYLDFITHNDCADRVLEEIIGFLFSDSAGWDVLSLQRILETSPTVTVLRSQTFDNLFLRETALNCSAVHLSSDWNSYVQNIRQRRFRTKIRSLTKQFLENKDLFLIECEQVDNLHHTLRSLFRLHNRRWYKRGSPGAFMVVARRKFYNEMSCEFFKQGRLRLYSLMRNENFLAHEINLEYNGRMYCLQQGYDPAYHGMGAGNMLKAQVLKQCIEKNIKFYDFLAGEDLYKRYWEAVQFRCLNFEIVRPKSFARLYANCPKIVNSIRSGIKFCLPPYLIDKIKRVHHTAKKARALWLFLQED